MLVWQSFSTFIHRIPPYPFAYRFPFLPSSNGCNLSHRLCGAFIGTSQNSRSYCNYSGRLIDATALETHSGMKVAIDADG
jgi:hypothetical protein